MLLDVMHNHFGRNKQHVSQRNAKVPISMELLAEFAGMKSSIDAPSQGARAVAPVAGEEFEPLEKLG